MSLDVLPSAVVLMVSWLKSHMDLAALHGGRVGTVLNPRLPAIRVQRISGSPSDPWQDNPVVQLDCWGATEAEADLLVRTVLAALPSARGVYATGQIWASQVDSGPYLAPDDPALSANIRYIVTLRLLTTTL